METKLNQQIRVFLNVNQSTAVADLLPMAEKVAASRGWRGAVRKNFLTAIESEVERRMSAAVSALVNHFGAGRKGVR